MLVGFQIPPSEAVGAVFDLHQEGTATGEDAPEVSHDRLLGVRPDDPRPLPMDGPPGVDALQEGDAQGAQAMAHDQFSNITNSMVNYALNSSVVHACPCDEL